jgi:uncharacterized protein YkwD
MDHGRRIWSLFVATLLASVVVAVPSIAPVAASDPWIDTSDRNAVIAAWQNEFGRAEPDMGFTGDVDTCTAGTTSQAFRDSVLQRVNWYRSMAGLGTVSENATFSARNQQAALMMAAEGSLSHGPGSGWACHTADGATAAGKSNLALGTAGVDAIDAYMQDFGASNTKVGHRRTILYPQVQEMGTGDVPRAASSWASNTLYVFDSHLWDDRPEVREERDFVAWPPSGYVPAETVWGRWSFSLDGADFSAATVTVTGPNGPVPVEVLERIQSNTRIAPEAAIVFAVDGDTNSGVFATPTNGDECYVVTIDGVMSGGSPLATFDYTTCLIDPTQTTAPIGFDPASDHPRVCLELSYSAWTTPCWAAVAPQNLPFVDVSTDWQIAPVGCAAGEHDRVVLPLVELAEPCVNVPSQRLDCEVGPRDLN